MLKSKACHSSLLARLRTAVKLFWFLRDQTYGTISKLKHSACFLLSWPPVVKEISPFVYPVDCHPLTSSPLQAPCKYSFVFRCVVFFLLFCFTLKYFQKLTWFKKKLCSTLNKCRDVSLYNAVFVENWREKVAGGENRHWNDFLKRAPAICLGFQDIEANHDSSRSSRSSRSDKVEIDF